MSNKDNGGPAFPCEYEGSTRSDAFGMTLRDYFAAKAMQSMIGSQEFRFWSPEAISSSAYFLADTMLEERKK